MINDRYKIIGKIGEGRSKVYLCEDILRADKRLAVKILSPTAENNEKTSFRDEFFLLRKLNHPNIISVFEYGTVVSLNEEDIQHKIDTASPFFTLEYFEGDELFEYKNLQQEPVLHDVIGQISSVLYYLHQSSYIYYDLKSENILIQTRDDRPVIKFIDFGLTTKIAVSDEISARGTAEYIAPEILRKERIDHRADLYSLGILLYRIIYGRFPFGYDDQLNIYKAHLDEEFKFPSVPFSKKITNLLKKLLSKEADKRFYTSIGVLNEIDSSAIKRFKNDWIRIPDFCGRNDSLSIISTYIDKVNGGEILSIKGVEGAGKSTLLNELYYKYPFSILISSDQNNDSDIWQQLLRGILYHQDIYKNLQSEIVAEARRILDGETSNLVEELKAIIIKLISNKSFILLIDNFNLLSSFDQEIFLQLIPVLQISKIKIVITEDSSFEYRSTAINNLQSINLNPFTESQVIEFIQKSFADFYPKDEVRKAVILYSDVLPGSIEIFLKDLVLLNILNFTSDGPVIEIDENLDRILKGSHEEIYRFRLNNLDSESKELAVLLSLFNINLDINTIMQLKAELSWQQLTGILMKLSEANIIHYNGVLGTVQFTSQGMKEYIASTIEDLQKAHHEIAALISDKIPGFKVSELARHWELAGEYERTYETLKKELTLARNTSALAYERNLLEHLYKLPLENDSLRNVKIELGNCLFQIGEYNAGIALTGELLENPHSSEEEISLKILKGKALISTQLLDEGKKLLESVLDRIKIEEKKNEILAEITEAEYEMTKYKEAEELADQIIKSPDTSTETKGKIYRIKGLIELFKNNDPNVAVKYFEDSLTMYRKAKLYAKVASMENNLGNLFNILQNGKEAEKHWHKAIEMNSSIGNIQQQGGVLINYGIYHFEQCNFEKAIEEYLKALPMFKTSGDKFNHGLVLSNLGEVQLIMCEYEKAINSLETAKNIFNDLDNALEKGEALFLLGKLYFELGDIENLINLNKLYEEIRELDLDRLNFNYDYLKVLYKILTNETSEIKDKLLTLRDTSKSFSSHLIFCEIQIKIIDYFFRDKQYANALKELISEEFVKICSKNIYFDSYRKFLLGRVQEVERNAEFRPALTYYEEALNQMGGISITELTWRALLELSRAYEGRGNISRADEYKKYAKQTVLYIINQIKSSRLRKIYLQKSERKILLNNLGIN